MTFVQPGDRIAVTGATGFVGKAMVQHLAESGYQIVGISERPTPPASIERSLSDYICADLTGGWPDTGPVAGVVHLAGLAAVQPSFGRPQDYLNINSSMVTRLFEYALQTQWRGRAIVVSSGAIYGNADCSKNQGFNESCPPAATSPYVVSKLLVEIQTEYYRRQGIDAIVVRPFNHIGPGQARGFIVPDLTAKVAEWQHGTAITVGSLDSFRDYTDVRDIVRAYSLLLEQPSPSETTYNVCSGSAHSGWEILTAICETLGSPIPPTTVITERAIDPQVITGDAQRLKRETGWEPKFSLKESIRDFINADVASPFDKSPRSESTHSPVHPT